MRSSLARTLRQAYREFSVLNPARHGAALAFYGAFALVPILAVSYHLTRTLLAERGVLRLADMQAQFAELLGPEAALAIQAQVAEATARTQNGSALVTVVGVVALLYTASGAFAQLKYYLNTIWGVPHEVQLRTGKMVVTRLLGGPGPCVDCCWSGGRGQRRPRQPEWAAWVGSDVRSSTSLSFILVTLLFTLLYGFFLTPA
jgi:uncharacterized BrkB/YihY/UPF0761 family membrane protein